MSWRKAWQLFSDNKKLDDHPTNEKLAGEVDITITTSSRIYRFAWYRFVHRTGNVFTMKKGASKYTCPFFA
jgi:hypothetical protein